MKLTFGSNVQSLGVQRYLSSATESLGQRFERLSSGLRINRASDDAAGLAIADRLRADAVLSSGAYRNINDGISLLNIASGTLGQQTNILIRLQELAEQSANGTYSDIQRRSLSKEYVALTQEFGRLGASTTFNGVKLLAGTHNGSPASLFLQAGITGSSTSLLSVQNSNTGVFSGRIESTKLSTHDILGLDGDRRMVFDSHSDMIARVGNVDGREVYVGFYQASGYESVDVNVYEENSDGSFTAIGFTTFSYNQSTGQVSANGAQTVSITYAGGEIGSVYLDFRGLEITTTVGAGTPNLGSASNLEFTNIEYSSSALTALDTVRRRLDDLNLIKGQLGAFQSRLSIASQISQITRETSLAAESRIRDTDVAEEAAGLVAATIRQQTATAVLGKVNRAPELLLQLLKS